MDLRDLPWDNSLPFFQSSLWVQRHFYFSYLVVPSWLTSTHILKSLYTISYLRISVKLSLWFQRKLDEIYNLCHLLPFMFSKIRPWDEDPCASDLLYNCSQEKFVRQWRRKKGGSQARMQLHAKSQHQPSLQGAVKCKLHLRICINLRQGSGHSYSFLISRLAAGSSRDTYISSHFQFY